MSTEDPLFAELRAGLTEGRSPAVGLDGGSSLPAPEPERHIKKVTYTHDGMIDMILANPMISQNELAGRFGYSATWISNIMQSDAFKARLHERKDALVDPVLRQTIDEQFKGLVARSMEIIRHNLNKPVQDVPVGIALKIFEVSSRAAGYGAKVDDRRQDVNVNIHLETMADNLTGLLKRKKAEAIEHDPDAS